MSALSINEFQGEYRWLSNFWPANVVLDGQTYPSVENAYQAAKTSAEHRAPFLTCSAADAKKLGKTVPVRDDWEEVKLYIMGDLVSQKFAPGSELASRLAATGAAELIEGNAWGDTFWGVSNGKGQNRLGKLIMICRDRLLKMQAVVDEMSAATPQEVRAPAAPARIYTGIGSRKTPPEVLDWMRLVASRLAGKGYILRSGAADGADSAFEAGCDAAGGKAEIWLPWRGFNNHGDTGLYPSDRHAEVAKTVHPAWDRLSRGPKALHARNVGQVLGGDIASPADFVLCWTPDGCESEATRSKDTGGTGTAIALASRHGIPVFNLANPDAKARFARFIICQHREFHRDGGRPSEGQIFVFGSNLAGRHGAGAAKAALDHYGAIFGQGSGRQGQSYAIPTKDGRPGTPSLSEAAATLPLDQVKAGVDAFIQHAKMNSAASFFVTRVGCGLAGYKDAEIAPLFVGAPINCSFPDEWKPWLGPAAAISSTIGVTTAKPNPGSTKPKTDQLSLFEQAVPAPVKPGGISGYVRVVSKRKGGVQAETGETVIDGDRKNPIFGNRHYLNDWQDADERRAVIEKHKTEDYWPDVLSEGPIYQEMKRIAENVNRGDCVALSCWCAPLPCHCDHIADGIRHLAAGEDLKAVVEKEMKGSATKTGRPSRQLF